MLCARLVGFDAGLWGDGRKVFGGPEALSFRILGSGRAMDDEALHAWHRWRKQLRLKRCESCAEDQVPEWLSHCRGNAAGRNSVEASKSQNLAMKSRDHVQRLHAGIHRLPSCSHININLIVPLEHKPPLTLN